MGSKRRLCLAIAVAVAGWRCASPASAPSPAGPTPPASAKTSQPPSPKPVVEGESLETAVLVPADNEEDGVTYENEWIYRHYGRFRRRSGGLASLAGRRYDVIRVELSDRTERVLYFDITDFFGREKPGK